LGAVGVGDSQVKEILHLVTDCSALAVGTMGAMDDTDPEDRHAAGIVLAWLVLVALTVALIAGELLYTHFHRR
jgi:hypothetical protein